MTLPYESRVSEAEAQLHAARDALNADIASYPTPVSGCDVQFNRLLSDRTRILRAIQALNDMPFVATPRIAEPGARVESR